MPPQEQVLVLETRILSELGLFQGLEFDIQPYLQRIFAPGALRFMPRRLAENDPNYKQLIPYVIMNHGRKFLTYVRGKRAGETRLVSKRSIGIGGHINPTDESLFHADLRDVYLAAVERELAEEVTVNAAHTDTIVALLNDDSNDVGRVHLGIVHLWTLDAENVTKNEQMITQMSFATIEQLRALKDTMETWSQLCLDGLEEIQARSRAPHPS